MTEPRLESALKQMIKQAEVMDFSISSHHSVLILGLSPTGTTRVLVKMHSSYCVCTFNHHNIIISPVTVLEAAGAPIQGLIRADLSS